MSSHVHFIEHFWCMTQEPIKSKLRLPTLGQPAEEQNGGSRDQRLVVVTTAELG
jgi:hypothetical protein